MQRANLIQSYGLQSRERITIDEEINSIIKIFESNLKRLNGIIVTYSDKKGKEVDTQDIKQREWVIKQQKETMKLFKNEYEGQTKAFKSGKPMARFNPSLQDKEDPDEPVDATGIDFSQDNLNQGDENADLAGKPDFERNLILIERKLQQLEKKYLMQDQDLDMAVQWRLGEHMTHSYFLDTVQSFRPNWLCYLDLILVVLIISFFMGSQTNFYNKGWIKNPH